ncbi:helix-turn-helix transcriptional regulator, partial [bacterium]|nr:helix-turn-helix transcriptional regulator [bacterium]
MVERLLVNIGKGIKFVRIASGIRQGVMAKRLNISQNYLSLLENNKAEPSVA